MTLVKGHALSLEGAPFKDPSCSQCHKHPSRMRHGVGGKGHGRCSCGAFSQHLASGKARQDWHRAHKAKIRDEEA